MNIELPPPPLPGFISREYPFRRRMLRIGDHRVHFVDEGNGQPVILFHGNPMWGFLWRKVIACLARDRRFRIVVPDLLGFGLSDKLPRPSDHRVNLHVDTMTELMSELGLSHPVLVGQDWGGPIAAGVGMNLSRSGNVPLGFVFSNTAVIEPVRPFRPKAFHRFSHVPVISDVAFRGLLFPMQILPRVQGDRSSMAPRTVLSYAWPLRKVTDRAAPLGLARMVPTTEEHPSTRSLDDIGAFMRSYAGKVALVWGERDPILGRALGRHRRAFPDASVRATDAGHFLQEEVPEEIAGAIREVAGPPA